MKEDGFTLVETLVALLVLTIATAGLMRAVDGHIESVRGLQDRAAAQWVAENRLAELGLPGADLATGGDEEMLGRRFEVEVETRPTDDPDLAQVAVRVRREGETQPLTTLRGFVDRGALPPPPPIAPATFAVPVTAR